jgi:hypothetical protein
VVQAAYMTTRGPGFKFALSSTASLGGHSFSFSGEGSIDEGGLQGGMSLQVGGEAVTEIIKNPYVYVKVPGAGGAAFGGATGWVKANIDTFSQALGASESLGGNTTEPTQLLNLLKATGQVTTLGSQSVRGVATTHYHALVDFGRIAATAAPGLRAADERFAQQLERLTGSNSLPIDVWVDASQRVRRFSTQLQMCTPQGTLAESVTMELFDYGPQPDVLVPAASEVTDITGNLESQISHTLAQLTC